MLLSKILNVHSINIFSLLMYCYFSVVRQGSLSVSPSILAAFFMGVFIVSAFYIIFKNHKAVSRAVLGDKKVVILVLLVMAATIFSKTTIFIVPLLFALTAIGENLRSMLKYYLLWSVVLFFGIIILQSVGFIAGGQITQYTSDGTPFAAQSLGFGNPNGAFTFLLSILITGYALMGEPRRKKLFTTLALGVIFFVYMLTLSRTGLICSLAMVALAHVGSFVPWVSLKKMLPSIFISLIVVSIFLAILFGEQGNSINDTMSNRPYWWALRIEDGALFNMIGNADSFMTNFSWWRETAPLDSFYLRVWFRNGLLILLLYFLLFRIWSRKINNKMLVFGALIALFYGFSEYGIMSNPGRNVILLIMMVPIFSKYMTSQTMTFLGGSYVK